MLLLAVKGRIALYPIPASILIFDLLQQDQCGIVSFFNTVNDIAFRIRILIDADTRAFYDSQCIAILIPHGMIHFIEILGCFFSPVGIGGIGYIHAACLVAKEAAMKLKLLRIQIRV